MSVHDDNKALLAPLLDILRKGPANDLHQCLKALLSPEARIRLGHPIGEMTGPSEFWNRAYAPLIRAMPDLERRDFIVMAGPGWRNGRTGDWIGLGGNAVGTLVEPWLGIPATGRPVFMRYHEYLRIEDGKIVEMEGLWDIPQVMLQAGAWPLASQLGVEWMCPGPAHGRGVIVEPHDEAAADRSVQIVWDMLHDLGKGDAETPDRGLDGFWHPNCLWYGPTGIGSARGHLGIRDAVLKGFRSGLDNNVRALDAGVFFGDHDLVAFSGWPSGTATHSGDGFLGLAPTGRRFTRRSLDFWRIEDGQIRENWVMIDMLDIYRQLGIDLFARMAALYRAAGVSHD